MLGFLFSLLAILIGEPLEARFSEIDIELPFKEYLAANPLLMEVTGAKIIRLPNGNQVILAVASTSLKDGSAGERLRAEKVCRVKALASILVEKKGFQIAHVEKVSEKTVITIENGKEKGKTFEGVLQITRTKVEGIVKNLPVIGRWKSREGEVFYLAIGAVCDKRGEPIKDKR
jgi:hypothetical protein